MPQPEQPSEDRHPFCNTHAAAGKDHRSGPLGKVLLVVIFNWHDHLATSVPTFVDLWGGVFKDIKYCSDTKVPNHPDMIHAPLMREGRLMYQCTLAAMTQFEGQFEGYLFMGDDVLLNTSYLSALDTTAMWVEPTAIHFSTSDLTKTGGKFALWANLKPGGADSAVLVEANPSLAPEDLAQVKSTGWVHATCDVYYFPASAVAAFQYLAPIFLDAEVHFSNAVATMMQLIRRRGVRIQHWHGLSKWFYDTDRLWWQKHLPGVVGMAYYHPFKLSRFDRSNRSDVALACKFAHTSGAHQLTSAAARAALGRQAPVCNTHAAAGKDHRSGPLGKVLLVVIFNWHDHLATSVPTFVDLWGGVFKDIKYCSDTKVPNHPDMIHAPLMREGRLMYQCTLAAMTQFEGQFEGYLFMGDDVLLNTSYLSALDTTAMWVEPTAIHFSTSDLTKTGGKFALWANLKPGGADSAVLVEANPSLAPEDLAQVKSTGWVHATCDVYYFPASAVAAFQYLAPIFLDAEVYFSNAVPTMMQLIRRRGVRIQHWHGLSKWFYDTDRLWWQKHLPGVVGMAYYHPFKLSRFDRSNRSDVALACKFAHTSGAHQLTSAAARAALGRQAPVL